jgi:CzcA family heavy metal efflux pump
MLISVTGDSTSTMDLRTLTEWNIRARLLAIGGVAQVVVIGGDYKQYQVLASPQRMKQFGVTLNELAKACEEASVNAAGGFMNQYGNEYVIRGIGRTNDLEELGKTAVKFNSTGNRISIADVAEIRIGAGPKIGDGSLEGKPAVIMTVMKQPGVNTLELTRSIDEAVADLSKTLPEDVQVNTHVFRQADFIEASIGNIQKTLVEGSIFVVVILFVFLMNWRATTISLLAIPISLLAAVLTLKWFGFTINTMSLGGMAIAIGDLVDDAIIDVENVYRRLKENAAKPFDDRQPVFKVIYNASVEIRSSVINATFIIIAAFIPLFFLSGMEGRLLVPLGIAFILSLFASLVVAITLTPVLCSYLLTSEKSLSAAHRESWLVRKLNFWYEGALKRALKFHSRVLVSAFILFAGAVAILYTLGRSFLPEFNEGSLVISAVTMPGISLDESNKIGTSIEKILLTIPEVKTTVRRTGRAELDEHALGVNTSEVEAPFELTDRDRQAFMTDVREKLSGVVGANVTIGQPIGHRIDHMLSGTRANIAIKIFGPDLSTLFSISNQVKSVIQDTKGLVDLSVEQQIDIPQIQIKARREMLARYGITIGEFAEFVDVAFAGKLVGDIYEDDKRFDFILRFDESNRGSMENIRNAWIDSRDGRKIPLIEVAEIVSSSGPNTINRENVQRKTVVSANVSGRDQRSVVDEIQQKIGRSVKLPEGYRIEFGGQFEAEEEASRTLVATSILSLLIIFLLLYLEFHDAQISGIILLNLPLALIGGVMSIWLTSGIISIPAIIGFITLFGIATRNGILLVSHYRTLQAEGKSLIDTVVIGSRDRLSPILMTALTAGLALIPLALGGDLAGNEIQSPMAKVILGGLLSSTLLNIFVVPIVYFLSQRKQHD